MELDKHKKKATLFLFLEAISLLHAAHLGEPTLTTATYIAGQARTMFAFCYSTWVLRKLVLWISLPTPYWSQQHCLPPRTMGKS